MSSKVSSRIRKGPRFPDFFMALSFRLSADDAKEGDLRIDVASRVDGPKRCLRVDSCGPAPSRKSDDDKGSAAGKQHDPQRFVHAQLIGQPVDAVESSATHSAGSVFGMTQQA